MNSWIVIIFVLALFALSMGGLEDERNRVWTDWVERTELRNEGLAFEEGMRKIDSLWTVWQEMK